MRLFVNSLALGSILMASACASDGTIGKRDPGQKLVNACLIETGVPGAYSSPAGQKIPEVTPVTKFGGTREGAASINECIRQKAAAGETAAPQTSAKTTYTHGTPPAAQSRPRSARPAAGSGSFCPKHAPVIYGGAIYCIGN